MKKFDLVRIGMAFMVLVVACGYAQAGDNAGTNPPDATLQTSVVYPSDGILAPGQPEIVRIAATVQPSPGIPVHAYRLLLKVRGPGGRTVLSDSLHPDKVYSVATLSTKKLVPDEYDLTVQLRHDGQVVAASQPYRLSKRRHIHPTPAPTFTATPTLTATATPTTTRTATATVTATATRAATATASPTATRTTTATATATTTPKATVTATRTASATPTATATPSGCQTIPGTSTRVGAACFPRTSCPALNNPQDPVSYGADKTGNDDSTSAFQSAVNAGDLYVSEAGTYLINLTTGGHGVVPPAGRNVVCAAGVTLKTTLHTGGHDTAIIAVQNSNTTVCGCDFQGDNTGSGAKTLDNEQNQFLIFASGGSNITIEGNSFENTWANSAIQFNTDYTGVGASSSVAKYNTFSGNPYYGPEVDNGNGITIENNLSTDSPIGVEDDACSSLGPATSIVVQDNMLQVKNGDCALAGNSGCDSAVFITGGDYPSGCNYSSNTVTGNYCVGSSVQRAQVDNVSPGGGAAASYGGNILGTDCICEGGSGC